MRLRYWYFPSLVFGDSLESSALAKSLPFARLINAQPRLARLNESMHLFHVHQRQLHPLRQVALDDPVINQLRQLLIPLMMLLLVIVDVVVVRTRTKPTPNKRKRLAHELRPIHVELSLHDAADFPEGSEHFGYGMDVLLRSRGDVGVLERDV